jgi:hypothetical protein
MTAAGQFPMSLDREDIHASEAGRRSKGMRNVVTLSAIGYGGGEMV